MKLELKHITPYLPYGVHLMNSYGNWHNTTLNKSISIYQMLEMKPILRPLSDLKVSKSLFGEYNWEYPKEFIDSIEGGYVEYIYMLELFKNHFDVFGLIEKGLAIDKNTI